MVMQKQSLLLIDELIKFRKKYGNKTILITIENQNGAGGFSEIADVGGKLEILFCNHTIRNNYLYYTLGGLGHAV